MRASVKRGPALTRSNCVSCGKEFEYLWVRRPKKYCSLECRPSKTPERKAIFAHRSYLKNSRWFDKQILTKPCNACGEAISYREGSKKNYCNNCVASRAAAAAAARFVVQCGHALCSICGDGLPTIRHLHQKICVKCRESVTDTAIRKVLRRYTPGWNRIRVPEQLQLIRAHRIRKLVLRKIGQMRV